MLFPSRSASMHCLHGKCLVKPCKTCNVSSWCYGIACQHCRCTETRVLLLEMVGTGYCGYWVQGSETLGPSTWNLSQIALCFAILGPKHCTLSQNKVNLQKYQSLWKVYVLICLPLIPCQLWLHIYGSRSDLSTCARGWTSRMQSEAQAATAYTPIWSKTNSTPKYDY